MSKPRPAPRKSIKVGEMALSKMTVAESMAAFTMDGTIARREFKLPELPPGVRPKGAAQLAMDNAQAGNMAYLNGTPGYCGLGFPGYTYLAELAQRSEYRAPAETTANEMTRAWIKITGAKEDKLKELTDAMKKFGVRDHCRTMILYDMFFGRGQISINIKGQDTDAARQLPLIIDPENKGKTIAQGSLLGFKPIEPLWTTPYMYNSIDPTAPDFYNPSWWYVLGKKTHATRLLTFVGRPLPDILKPSYNFGGMSMSQLTEPYVVRWFKTVDSVNRAISQFSLSGLATNLQAELEEDSSGGSLYRRAALFNQTRDNRGLMILDKDSEEFFQFNMPLTSLDKLQAQAQEHMAAPTHVPLVKLTGATPGGLNASSEGEIKVWYDHCAGEQENQITPHLTTMITVLQLHLWGAVDPAISFEWVPLDSPTDDELSKIRKSDADAGTSYVTGGVVSPEEERERLRNDPNSGYTHLTGPAPPTPLEEGADIDEEGKQADHERGKETAGDAHKRALELERVKSANKPKPGAK